MLQPKNIYCEFLFFIMKNFYNPQRLGILIFIKKDLKMCAPIAQLDRVPDFESVGYRFDSYWAHQTTPRLRLARHTEGW